MSRLTCYRCFWPKALCWCQSIQPIATETRFVFLMHPKEYKQEKAATGRLTHLCLTNSAIHVGIGFDEHTEVQALLRDPAWHPVLLYPGKDAVNLSTTGQEGGARPPEGPERSRGAGALAGFSLSELNGRRLLVFLLDATWSLGKKMLRLSPSLQRLPRVMFTPQNPSRFVIKQQPHTGCLSTLEATHELLGVLEQAGLDRYERPTQLLDLFHRMQDYQIRCALDPSRPGYRRQPYSLPEGRTPLTGRSGSRRSRIFTTS